MGNVLVTMSLLLITVYHSTAKMYLHDNLTNCELKHNTPLFFFFDKLLTRDLCIYNIYKNI